MIEGDIWYVSYTSNIVPVLGGATKNRARATRRFKTESEAKQFAQDVIKNGWSAIAGTLNPHSPKKVVASNCILDWIGTDC